MKPIEFPQQTRVLAKDQPQYEPLPVHFDAASGACIGCFELSEDERKAIAEGAPVWLWQYTFGRPFQPVALTIENPWQEQGTRMDDKEFITLEEAVKRLPNGDTVHTFRQGGLCLIGTDYERDRLIESMKNAPEIEVTGTQAQEMGHGLAIKDEHGWLFIETSNSGSNMTEVNDE